MRVNKFMHSRQWFNRLFHAHRRLIV